MQHAENTPNTVAVLMSASIPAPPHESLPAIVSMVGTAGKSRRKKREPRSVIPTSASSVAIKSVCEGLLLKREGKQTRKWEFDGRGEARDEA